jgi:hypothetical protein
MVEKKTCSYCGGPNERARSPWCSNNCRWNEKARRSGMDCSVCGERMPKTAANRPEGKGICSKCRKARREEELATGVRRLTVSGRVSRSAWRPELMVCLCGVTFLPTHHRQKYCVSWHQAKYASGVAKRKAAKSSV